MRLNLLIAPPGWGKTYRLLEWIKYQEGPFIFVFPLRALCEEVYQSALERRISCLCLRSRKDHELYLKLKPKLLISTPELLQNLKVESSLYLLDEFHLYFYWGESFREGLLDFMEEHLASSPPVILLSATMSQKIQQKMRELFMSNYNQMRVWDFGNQKLRNDPSAVYLYFSKKTIMRSIFYDYGYGTKLIFCEYREEVKTLNDELNKRGFKSISCVGGEAFEFSLKLREEEFWDYIVATTVVSHGVNLPVISKVFFTYKVNNLDFYLQMVGRAGRDGSSFEVHTLTRIYFRTYLLIKGFWLGFLKSFGQRWRYYIYSYYES